MNFFKFLAVTFFILQGPLAWGQVSCKSLLDSGAAHRMSARWQAIPIEDQRNFLLIMLGSNSQPSISRKDIFEKGEMDLGLPVGDGRTLILSYQADSRNELKYKLVQMRLLDQAAVEEKIENRPLDTIHLELTQKVWKDLEKIFGQQRVNDSNFFFPLTIEKQLLDFLKRTEGWIDQIHPHELATLKTGQREYRRLSLLGQRRRFIDFLANYLPKKILWKTMEWGAMFAVISSATSQVSPGPTLPLPALSPSLPHEQIVDKELLFASKNDLIAIIRTSALIQNNERFPILHAVEKQSSNFYITANSPLLNQMQTEIRTTTGRDIWILNRQTEKIYLATFFQHASGSGTSLTTPVFIEIQRESTPATYQNALALFISPRQPH